MAAGCGESWRVSIWGFSSFSMISPPPSSFFSLPLLSLHRFSRSRSDDLEAAGPWQVLYSPAPSRHGHAPPRRVERPRGKHRGAGTRGGGKEGEVACRGSAPLRGGPVLQLGSGPTLRVRVGFPSHTGMVRGEIPPPGLLGAWGTGAGCDYGCERRGRGRRWL